MNILYNEDAVNERVLNPIKYGIKPCIIPCKHILRSVNPFVNGYMMMREVEKESIA